MERIGVAGLGRMGAAIAARYAAAGWPVTGWTRSGRGVPGVPQAHDLAALAAASDTLILSLFDDAAVADVLDTLLTCDLSGRLIVETSTVVPTVMTDRVSGIAARGGQAVDAPISGGPELVAAGTCGVFIGGDDAAAGRAVEVLGVMSDRLFHVGPLGAGLVMKTINNGMAQIYFGGLSELMPLARKAGLPLETALRILCGGPVGAPIMTARIPKVLGEDTTVGFTIAGAVKDNDVFRRVMQAHGLSSEGLDQAAKRQARAVAAGLAEADPAAMIRTSYDNE